MYKVLGEDGQEYDLVSAKQIRQWIRENRVDKKTPVFPDGVNDWVFLESLPEFADAFSASPKMEAAALIKKRRARLAFYVGLAGLLLIAALIALFIFKNKRHY